MDKSTHHERVHLAYKFALWDSFLCCTLQNGCLANAAISAFHQCWAASILTSMS